MKVSGIYVTVAEHANAVRIARRKAAQLAWELRAMNTPHLTPKENARAIRANVRGYLGTALHFALVKIVESKRETKNAND